MAKTKESETPKATKEMREVGFYTCKCGTPYPAYMIVCPSCQEPRNPMGKSDLSMVMELVKRMDTIEGTMARVAGENAAFRKDMERLIYKLQGNVDSYNVKVNTVLADHALYMDGVVTNAKREMALIIGPLRDRCDRAEKQLALIPPDTMAMLSLLRTAKVQLGGM